MTVAGFEHRSGGFCLYHGHLWRATGQHGKYQCANCKTVTYCPGCVLTLPRYALTMHCKQHQEGTRHA